MRKLKPPKRYRSITPSVCAFCIWFTNEGTGSCYCARAPDDVGWDTGDARFYQRTCDRFKQDKSL